MHVLHVGKYYPPYRGGIETVMADLCSGLAARGHRATALVSNVERTTREETLDGVHIVRVGRCMLVNSQPINPGFLSALRNLDFDILHFHTPNPIGALVSLLGAKKRPVVVSHHGDILRQRVLGPPATLVHAALYAQARSVVAATPRHIESSPLLRAFRSRCRVIHYPIRPEPFAEAGATWDPELPQAWQDQALALFVGRFVYYKGLDVLLDAMTRVHGIKLALVGTGPLASALHGRVAAQSLHDSVRFLGEVSEERVRALYRRARFFVLPSASSGEAFGMVQLEAMAAGTPVISCNLPTGVPYVNKHGVTGLIVPPGDVGALAAAMQSLADDPAQAARLGAGGQARVAQEFHLDRVLDEWVDLYRSL
jgi:rhamnosyl/mannosyltransferase